MLDCAIKNKIALLYFESLLRRGNLIAFRDKYYREEAKYSQFCLTLTNVCNALNKQFIPYAVVKTLMPYHAIPNDVDIILFNNNHKAVIHQLLSNGYEKVGEVLYETWLHDLRDCSHGNSKKKDVYDTDLYNEIGASYLVYLSKERMKKFRRSIKFMDSDIGVLAPESELLLVIFHSIFPEQIFTLSHYYDLLHQLHNMDSRQIDNLVEEIKANNMTEAARIVMTIVIILHYEAFSNIPNCMKRISNVLNIRINLAEEINMPYKHGILTLTKVLLEKLRKEQQFRQRMVKQIQSTTDLRFADYMLSVIMDRRRRKTY